MPPLLEPQYEQFCRLVARGSNYKDAYAEVGYVPNNGSASQMAARPYIQERIIEIRQSRCRQIERELEENPPSFDEEWLCEELRELADLATQIGDYDEARECINEISKIKGIGADRRQNLPARYHHGAPAVAHNPNINLNVLLAGAESS